MISCLAHRELAREVAERSLTLVRDERGLLPLKLDDQARIGLFMPCPRNLTPADTSSFVRPSLAAAIRAYHSHVEEILFDQGLPAGEVASLREKAAEYDLLLLGTIDAGMDEGQALLANELLKLDVPLVTIALRTPYDLAAYNQAQTQICTYSILDPSMQALAGALWGRIPFRGRLPVTVDGLAGQGHG